MSSTVSLLRKHFSFDRCSEGLTGYEFILIKEQVPIPATPWPIESGSETLVSMISAVVKGPSPGSNRFFAASPPSKVLLCL